MPYSSLAEFLEDLSHQGQLARIEVEVDRDLEIAEITRRVARDGGPALLFDRVRGQTMAVVTNLLGTDDRVRRALDLESLDDLWPRVESLIERHTPQTWFDRLKTSSDDAGANRFRPKTVKNGPCGQVAHLGRDVDLASLPLVKQWSSESRFSITAGPLISQAPGLDPRGSTLCAFEALDANTLAVLDDGHSAFARHWEAHSKANEKMPVAIVLGSDPAGLLAAHLELPDDLDAYHFTGLLRGRPLEVVKCRTHALEVPAEADLVIEGYLDPGAAATVVSVTAITHRTRPIFPVMIDCGPHGETAALFHARQRMILPTLRTVAPAIVDLHLPVLGGLHRYAFVAMRKTQPFQARQVASALWGSPALRYTKFVVLVDHDVDVHDTACVLSAVGANVAAERDVFSYDGPAHRADFANSMGPLARHLGIDATRKIEGERTGVWPAPLAAGEAIEQLVTARWGEYKLPTQFSAAPPEKPGHRQL
jgi:4-hydroxy-3-polyprenylbenzoate decarboxylase